MAELEFQGFDEFGKALNETMLNLTQKRKLIAKSLRAGGQILSEEQKVSAPDDPETADSRIRENLGVSVVDQTATGAEARIGSKKWGWIARFADIGTMHQPGTGWMRKAYDRRIEEAATKVEDVMGAGIEESYR
jgi:HK97 gp10 family phage protein